MPHNDQKAFKLNTILIVSWLFIAAVYTGVSLLFKLHQQEVVETLDIVDMSFYHFIPIVIWVLIAPLIRKLSLKYQLIGKYWTTNLLFHFVISVFCAPFIRYISILLDFSIKSWTGIMDGSAIEVTNSVLLVILASTPKAVLYYWVVVLVTHWYYGLFSSQIGEVNQKDFLVVMNEELKKRLKFSDIHWIESSGNYIIIHTESGKYSLRMTLKGVSKLLDKRFLRVHRSAIANTDHIDSLKHWRRGEYVIIMKNQKTLTSSRTYKPNIDLILQA